MKNLIHVKGLPARTKRLYQTGKVRKHKQNTATEKYVANKNYHDLVKFANRKYGENTAKSFGKEGALLDGERPML